MAAHEFEDSEFLHIHTCKRPWCTVIVPSRDKVDESLSLWGEGGLKEFSIVTEGFNGTSGDELCGTTAAVYLTRQEADGRGRAESDILLGESEQGKRNIYVKRTMQ